MVPQPPSPSCPLSPVLAVPSQGQLEIGDDGDTQSSAGASALVGLGPMDQAGEDRVGYLSRVGLGPQMCGRVWAS
jgi:hypothetical protein